jgi:hypothetical protein
MSQKLPFIFKAAKVLPTAQHDMDATWFCLPFIIRRKEFHRASARIVQPLMRKTSGVASMCVTTLAMRQPNSGWAYAG